jgi:hypothetical protein
MELERGTMHARIWAPPRFFLVETPAALAVDLGCIYTLRIDSVGGGVLTVISGQVELVRSGRRSLVPAGNEAEMRPGAAPGTPYPVGSSPEFRGALQELDFGSRTPEALQKLLHEAHGPATITLWHLLPRLDAGARAEVFARLAAVAPPPSGVTREGVLALDARMLARWQHVLEPSWSTERPPAWKKSWRRLWNWYQSA